ncbi:MAG: tyrosine-type recombinase/integrase [Hyphomicrobiales bacterium]|nr:tyrosine-type recombinase/integrase [Hyphomicrobiales bacterium]
MSRYCAENERLKHEYISYLRDAKGKQQASIDSALRAIARFEASTGLKPFRKFRIEQVRKFREDLRDATGPTGEPLSASTIIATLRQAQDFFVWLSREPGFRKSINDNDIMHFTPSERDNRIASARRERWIPEVDDVRRAVDAVPEDTPIAKRDRALLAFALVSGARDGALRTLRLKHVDFTARSVFHDAREVATKNGKTFKSFFFPVGDDLAQIVSDYVAFLRDGLHFGPDDPLFPSTQVGHGEHRDFQAVGLSREPWATTEPIRRIFREAFTNAGLPYVNPHSFRKTIARLGQRLCKTPESWKAWSQNMGHESEATTFVGYGQVASERQAQIIRELTGSRITNALDPALVETLKTALALATGKEA